jgi:hypothetical protein
MSKKWLGNFLVEINCMTFNSYLCSYYLLLVLTLFFKAFNYSA